MKIRDICVGITDGSHNPPQGIEISDYLMLSSKNVFDGKITFDAPRYLSQLDFEQEDERTKIKPGDVLLTIVGTVGRTAVVDDTMPSFTLQRSVAVLHPKVEMCNSRYLMYALQGKRDYIENHAKGVAQKGIYLKEVSNIDLRIPSIDEQISIVEVLDKVTSVIRARKQEIQKLDELIKSRFVEMFGDPIVNSMGLATASMAELCEIIDGDRGKNYPKGDELSNEGDCLFLNAKNVTPQGFNFNTCTFISREKDEALRKGKLTRGDVVLTTRGTIGNLAFYSNEIPYEHVRINSGMVILRMKQGVMDEVYFIEQFKMKLADVKEKIASGSAQPQLPISTMNKIQMLAPDITNQKHFSEFVREIDKSKLTIQKSLDELETLNKALMQKYFGGNGV